MTDSNLTNYSRRTLLATLGTGFLTGCLRTGADTAPTQTTSTAAQSETATATDVATATKTPEPPVSLSREWNAFFEPTGAPFVDGKTIYSGSRKGVRAIVADDGTERWRTEQELISLRGTLDNDALYYTSFLEPGLYRANAGTGAVEATADVGPAGGRPVVTSDYVVVGTDHNSGGDTTNEIVGLSKRDFSRIWSVSETDTSYGGGIAFDGRAIVGFGTPNQSRIEARNPATGVVEWAVDGYLTAPLQQYDGSLYAPVASAGVDLLKIAPADGTVVWRHTLEQLNDSMYVYTAAPTFDGDRAYFASYSQVHAIDLATGETVWKTTTDRPIKATPAIVGDYVWVVPTALPDEERNRELYGFDIETGEKVIQTRFAASTHNALSLGDTLAVVMENQVAAFSPEANT
ncbi:PQQ-like beta-propeller repeat protein [Halomicroarcula sp. F13]|uniref:PQQ-like beta-propeller repeat protein n=1 Tax=Haloarcula rubra TaxID=2487747 RepID=A0AAW4PXT6_9EURY|nr:PQQ-binding-like beta-propeller repeat protein [Halomicroarcula rubra]MBX0325426.1 PQQ-like beta-propeller repeat protein [Halomicroarcula rubra]